MSSTTTPRRFVSIDAAAEYLDLATVTIRRHIASGALPAYRVGRRIKIDLADLDRFAVRIPTTGAGGDAA